MTSQYGVRVLENRAPTLELLVLSISEDTPVPPEASELDLFVRFLCEGNGRKRSTLAARIASDGGDPLDGPWLWANAERYVSAVEKLSSKNEGAEGRFSSYSSRKRAFTSESTLAQATFRVVVTDAALVEHLASGDAWESSAYGWTPPSDEPSAEPDAATLDEWRQEELAQLRGKEEAAAVNLPILDSALANAAIVVWRTSGLSSGSYQVVLREEREHRAAIKALKDAGFVHGGTQYGESWLTRDQTQVCLLPWERAKVTTFITDLTEQHERASFEK